jgi:dTDP-4-amino-4,6-dideoxy-D-galactose acyltransferase
MTLPVADLLEWDSNFFGVRIGRVRPGPFDPAAVVAWQRENQIQCLYYLAEVHDTDSIHAAQDLGFHLVDIRTTFYTILPVHPFLDPTTPLRKAVGSDLPALRELTVGSFIHSRFYHDPHFPREKCDELYAVWVEKQLHQKDAQVWVTDDEYGVQGFVTVLDLNQRRTSISLIGLAVQARGRGLGHTLVNFILRERSEYGFSEFEVVTQACNSSAMNLYQSCGMRILSQQVWLHGWFNFSTNQPS